MKKKIISLFLAVIMIVGMLPLSAIPAFAADGAVARITEYSANDTLTFTYNSVEELNAALEAGRKGTDDKNGKFHGIKLEFFTDMAVPILDYSGNHARLEIELNHHTVKVTDSRNYRSQYIRIIDGTLDFCGESAAHNTDIFNLTHVSDFCSKNGIQLENVVFQNIATEKALTQTSSSNSGRLFNISDVGSDGGETLIIRDVTVKDGSFGDDGGAFNINKSKANPSVLFENCQFINLSSKGDGGAIQIENMVGASGKGASLGLKNCNFINCSAESEGGAIYIYEMNGSSSNRASVNLDGCNFSNCTAEDDGGAIFVDDEYIDIGNNDNPDDDAHKTLFINCSAQYGGAIFDDNGKNLFKNMIFVGNKATNDEWGGGAMHIFGDDTVVENCEFYLNKGAGFGGAVSIDADDAAFKNCIFAGNESNKGKDIYVGSNMNTPSITGCTVYGYSSGNSFRKGGSGIGDSKKNTFNTSVMRFSDASNYDEGGALIKGDSRENPVLLTNADDMIALAVNVKLDSGTYGDRFYKLDSDIHNVCTFIEDFKGKFIYDGHTLTTRLADIPYFRKATIHCFEHADFNGDFVCDVCGFHIGYYEFVPDTASRSAKVKRKCRTLLTEINASTTDFNLKDGWYIITENVTVNDRIYLSGDVHLILADNVTLSANKGISVGTSLSIYAQSLDPDTMGKLNASTTGGPNRCAAIGTDWNSYSGGTRCGDISIHGGIITACGGTSAAGIGSGENGSCGNVTIYGGTVTASGGEDGAGIGTGWLGSCGNITYYGGTLTASGVCAAGIGAGHGGTCGKVSINDDPRIPILAGNDENSAKVVSSYSGEFYVKIAEPDNVAEKVSTCIAAGHKAAYKNPADGLYYEEETYQTKIGDYHELIIWQTEGNGRLPLAHFGEWKETTAATCTEAGIESYICSVCGKTVDTRPIPALGEIEYYDFDENNKEFIKKQYSGPINVILNSYDGHALGSGWYYIKGDDVTVKNNITLSGDVHFILADGCHLKAEQGIQVGSSFTVYAQSADAERMGKITASGIMNYAGIGGGPETNCGNISINGGVVTATGGEYAAGIGSSFKGSCSNITINGGNVTAIGVHNAAGIGSGQTCSCGDIIINGGTVTATGRKNGAGIGSGQTSSCGDIIIYGGTVTATGGEGVVGIGAGYYGTCGTVIIPDYLDITAGADKNSAQSVTVYNGERYVQLTESDRKTQGKDAQLSSTFSGGNLWLIGGIAAVVIIGVAAYVVVKKKKKTATANGAEKEDEK